MMDSETKTILVLIAVAALVCACFCSVFLYAPPGPQVVLPEESQLAEMCEIGFESGTETTVS